MMNLAAVVLILTVAGIAKGSECSQGCHTENGFCEKPGKCRCDPYPCKPGWQGEKCEQCIPFPGCTHGSCEKAWQCLCEEGWMGSLCDQETLLCSSGPCSANATCIETGERGYLCVCPHGYKGDFCHLKKPLCMENRSPCQNGGSCMAVDGSPAFSSCLCPTGFSGDYCEININSCLPNPCLNGGNCTNHQNVTRLTCNDTLNHSQCTGWPCANGGTCIGQADGTFRCLCKKWFTGHTCSLQHRSRVKAKLLGPKPVDHRVFSLTPQHYSLPAHAFYKLLRPPERDLLKVTLKETVHAHGILVTKGQLVCFGMLALLTCLVILGTTGIVFFGRCETWQANAKYRQLVRQQREHLLKKAGSVGQDKLEHSINIILPEKIRLSSFGKHYTSI